MKKKRQADGSILQVPYAPPAGYGLDLEIFPLSELRRRVGVEYLGKPERIEFHLLVLVTEGHCVHMVDYEPIACQPGSLLMLRPGQVQCFDTSVDWQGWLVIFRPEFLQPRESSMLLNELDIFRQLETLSMHLALNENEQQAVGEGIERMFQDAQLQVDAGGTRHALLRSQLHAILIRLYLIQARCDSAERIGPVLLHRFKCFRLAVEQQFHHIHQVATYARLLGCSEKSLGRAVQQAAGVSAKTLLSRRIALEAKRLLAHTGLSVSAIADKLGFDEATNFVKFFRREAGCSPGTFRKKHAAR